MFNPKDIDPKSALAILKWGIAAMRSGKIAKEERPIYQRLLQRNLALWGRLEELGREFPESDILRCLLSNQGRPLASQQSSEDERRQMRFQDELWAFIEELKGTLKRYRWPVSQFVLVAWRDNHWDNTWAFVSQQLKIQDELLGRIYAESLKRWSFKALASRRLVLRDCDGDQGPDPQTPSQEPFRSHYGSPYDQK